jgi:hypothetical protein
MFFFIFMLVDGRIWIRTNKLRIRMWIQEAQKHTDEHCSGYVYEICKLQTA